MNTDMLIIGGDGDLALRKLYPSLFYLELNQTFPENTRIIGMARTGQSREVFLDKVYKGLKRAVSEELFSEELWQRFAEKIFFAQGDATREDHMSQVKAEHFNSSSRLIVYLAIPPLIFGKVCQSLSACDLVNDDTRLVVEKPLGDSRESFLAINNELSKLFKEEQLFRIDHYLGKESVQNLLALRFANDFFEPIWNSRYIDHIQITVTESVGVGNRWSFYDQTGATRDMVQNHLLQVLCLTAMEPPARLDADSVRYEKLKVLNCLQTIDDQSVGEITVRGQYARGVIDCNEVPGYTEEVSDKYDVDPNSTTETFVAIKAEILNSRWSGVPIYLRTGKRINKRHSEIVVQFKQTNHHIFNIDPSKNSANQLVIQLQPDEGIRFKLKHKVAGLDAGLPVKDAFLDLSLSAASGTRKHDAYARLLNDVFRDDQTLFVSAMEVEAAWKWVDQIFAGWKNNSQGVEKYEAGSLGPDRADKLIENDGRQWLNDILGEPVVCNYISRLEDS